VNFITENTSHTPAFSGCFPRSAKKSTLEETVVPVDRYESDRSEKEERKKTLICIFCGHVITFPDRAMEVSGGHLHTFSNPGGVVYQIGCFSAAPGCLDVSDPTLEYTWFPGYSWSISVCAGCMAHMGWHYRADGSGFYGLVLKNLTENL